MQNKLRARPSKRALHTPMFTCIAVVVVAALVLYAAVKHGEFAAAQGITTPFGTVQGVPLKYRSAGDREMVEVTIALNKNVQHLHLTGNQDQDYILMLLA